MNNPTIETLAAVILHQFELKMRENDPNNVFHRLWYNASVEQEIKREMEVQLTVAIAEVIGSRFGDLMDFTSAKNPPSVEDEYGLSSSDIVEVLVKKQASYGHLTGYPQNGKWEIWGNSGEVVGWRLFDNEE